MNIRNRILLYFTASTLAVTGIAFALIYILFAEYREEEFQQRLKEKITFTLKFLDEEMASNKSLLHMLDRLTINELYEEKTLLFDKDKKLIYTSLDDVSIVYSQTLLNQLNEDNIWIETKEDQFDVVAVCLNFENARFYGITKAYDTFGYNKLNYLKYALIIIYLIIAVLVVMIALYISRQISNPINKMAQEIAELKLDSDKQLIAIPSTNDEIQLLGEKFNELMLRLQESFAFQKHAVHHISHELKTPIAVLVSNFERIEQETDEAKKQVLIRHQKENTRHLGDIINALLEISKAESGNLQIEEDIRMDDLVFDIIEQIKSLHPNFIFKVDIDTSVVNEEHLTVKGNERLLKAAFSNLIHNSLQYSNNGESSIALASTGDGLQIRIENHGTTIRNNERQFLFRHFFRGENSQGTRGFGLGLVLIDKVVQLHRGRVTYQGDDEINVFSVLLPLRQSLSSLSKS
jgi:signal transduction histidine kinase